MTTFKRCLLFGFCIAVSWYNWAFVTMNMKLAVLSDYRQMLMMPSFASCQPSSTTFNNSKNNNSQKVTTTTWMDFWWINQLKGSSLRLDEKGMIVFPDGIQRVWIDVGVHRQTLFIPALKKATDLFVLGFEPDVQSHKPCPHDRCVVFWAACTSHQPQIVELQIRGLQGHCNSLLPANLNASARHSRGVKNCLRQRREQSGQLLKYNVPGMPLSYLLARIPSHIDVEYVKIDAQGYDLEVMKGIYAPVIASRTTTTTAAAEGEKNPKKLPHVVSLESVDIKDKSRLLYEGQATLDDIKEYLHPLGWMFVANVSTGNDEDHELNAYFALNETFASQISKFFHYT